MTQAVYAQASALAGQLTQTQQTLLQTLCAGAVTALTAQLRPEVASEDIQELLVTAAALYALAGLEQVRQDNDIQQFQAGDLTVRRGTEKNRSSHLRQQALALLGPYRRDGFVFREV